MTDTLRILAEIPDLAAEVEATRAHPPISLHCTRPCRPRLVGCGPSSSPVSNSSSRRCLMSSRRPTFLTGLPRRGPECARG